MTRDQVWEKAIKNAHKVGGYIQVRMLYSENGERQPIFRAAGDGWELLDMVTIVARMISEEIGIPFSALLPVMETVNQERFEKRAYTEIDWNEIIKTLEGGDGHGAV